jgi:hypothetical protein
MLDVGMKSSSEKISYNRKLLYFPIIHTSSDMGNLGEAVKGIYLNKVGRAGWKRKVDVVNKFWDQVSQIISGLDLEWSKVKIYQDGLPALSNGREGEIIQKLSESGSLNHVLVANLIAKGAILMGTESVDLLMEEYKLAKKSLKSGLKLAKASSKQVQERQDEILRERDRFIADRINDTLGLGEVGIIFLGMLHDIRPWLSEDIEVTMPISIDKGRR